MKDREAEKPCKCGTLHKPVMATLWIREWDQIDSEDAVRIYEDFPDLVNDFYVPTKYSIQVGRFFCPACQAPTGQPFFIDE